jgi:hypothetical protein
MSAHVLLSLTVNSKSERKVNSLPLLGFEPVIFGMLAHLSDHSAKSHPMNQSPSSEEMARETETENEITVKPALLVTCF